MLRALDEYEIAGCRTTIPFCKYVLKHESFTSGDYDTHFVPDHFSREKLDAENTDDTEVKALAAALLKMEDSGREEKQKVKTNSQNGVSSKWWKHRSKQK
jgi:propionyl-CoA carboxylase alpha chain